MSPQGWDRADFHCGRCGYSPFTATTEAEYLIEHTLHASAHDLVDMLSRNPQLRAAVARILGAAPELTT